MKRLTQPKIARIIAVSRRGPSEEADGHVSRNRAPRDRRRDRPTMHRFRAMRGDVVLVLQNAFEQERCLDDDGAIPCEQRYRANSGPVRTAVPCEQIGPHDDVGDARFRPRVSGRRIFSPFWDADGGSAPGLRVAPLDRLRHRTDRRIRTGSPSTHASSRRLEGHEDAHPSSERMHTGYLERAPRETRESTKRDMSGPLRGSDRSFPCRVRVGASSSDPHTPHARFDIFSPAAHYSAPVSCRSSHGESG